MSIDRTELTLMPADVAELLKYLRWAAVPGSPGFHPSLVDMLARIDARDVDPSAGAASQPSKAASDVLAERRRQIDGEGWTPEHDDQHDTGALCRAAVSYISSADGYRMPDGQPPVIWPWNAGWWKPKDRRHDLVRAAALVIAEIERLDRLDMKGGPTDD